MRAAAMRAGGRVNYRGRCMDYQCARFGLLPGQGEPRYSGAEYDTEARAWLEYYRTARTVRHEGP